MSEYQTFEHDGLIVESNRASRDELRASFGLDPEGETPPEAPPLTPAGAAPAADEAVPPPAEPGEEDTPAARDAHGRFAPKKDVPARNPEKRIDQAIARQRTAEEARDAAMRERDEIRARLAALETRVAPPPQAQAPAPPRPPDDAFPDYEAWAGQQLSQRAPSSYEAYLDARQDWRAEVHAQRQAAASTEQQRLTAHAQRIAQAKQQIPNFDQLVRADLPVTADVRDAIVESPVSPLLILHFSQHPDDLQRYARLTAAQTHREIGRLESWLMAGAQRNGSAPGTASAVVPSAAKPPGKPVGSSAPSPDPTAVTDDMPVDEWIARMNERDRKAGRR